MGLGMLADQLADLKLGELLSTPPPGLDEAAALAKVVQFAQNADYAKFSRIVIDTAPTGEGRGERGGARGQAACVCGRGTWGDAPLRSLGLLPRPTLLGAPPRRRPHAAPAGAA